MTYPSWKEAVSAIRRNISPCNDQERELASALRMQIPVTLPRIVAAARMQSELASRFGDTTRSVSEGQQEFLDTLAEEASLEAPTPESSAEAQSWIQYFFLRRRLKALCKLRLNKGDVVSRSSSWDELDEVASIGDNGVVYFTGGRSRAWPDRLTIVTRSDDSSPQGERARSIAANRASERSVTGYWSTEKQESLEDYRVPEKVSHEDLVRLQDVIESADDERPIQDLLQRLPQLLGSLVRGPWRYCIPKPSLGGTFVPDFLLAEVDSNGVRWILVELETPNSSVRMSTVNDFEVHARRGVSQIKEWRQWLQDNIAYARQDKEHNGLGLHGIRADPKGIVLVGRRRLLHSEARNLRSQLYEDSQIEMHTYDWLLEKLEGALQFEVPWAMNPHALQLGGY